MKLRSMSQLDCSDDSVHGGSNATGMTRSERILIVVATFIVAAAVLHSEPLQSANDRSRWATVWSLVERRTYQIDEIDRFSRWSTIDKVRVQASDGQSWHFYSSKPPFLSTLVAGLYAIERATLGYGLFNHTTIVSRLILLLINVVPFLCALISLSRTLSLLGIQHGARCFILAVAGFGSILNPYLTTLNNHTPAVACAMLSIAAAVRLLVMPRNRDFAWLGLYAAMTCCFELPAALLGVGAFILAVFCSKQQTLTKFIPAALLPLGFFFVTNWIATGGVKPFYTTYGTDTYRYVHNGIPSYWMNPRDLDANTESFGRYAFHCLVGHHGLLSLTPVLFLSLSGWFLTLHAGRSITDSGAKTQQKAAVLIVRSGALMTLVTLGFYLSRTENYNYGGNSVGLRWMLWLFPFWWIAIAEPLQRLKAGGMTVALILLAASVGTTNWSLHRPWRPSWIYEQMEAAGWIRYRTPVPQFDPPRRSLFTETLRTGLREQFVSSSGDQITLETQADANGTINLWVTSATIDDKPIIPTESLKTLPLDPAGVPPEVRRSASQDTPESQTLRAIQLIFGREPFGRAFSCTGETWIPAVSKPQTAWKVRKGLDRVYITDPFHGRCIQRTDAIFCDDLPLGILQWKTTILSDATGEELAVETWVSTNR